MRLFLCFIISFTLGMTGCNESGYPSTQLEGMVTVDQKPLTEGSLQFLPQESGQGPVVGGTIKEGRYVVEGVPLGKVLVTFNAIQKTHRLPPKNEFEGEQWASKNLIPMQSRSGVTIEVTADQSTKNFEL